MINIYELQEDSANYAVFYETFKNLEDTFIRKYSPWSIIDLNSYIPVELNTYKADNGTRNFKMDFGKDLALLIFSPRAASLLLPFLYNVGQELPIITKSIRKKFTGFYPNKNIYDSTVINWERSVWTASTNGRLIHSLCLNANAPVNDYMFVLEDMPSYVYVTDKFKDLVESNNLVGFDFSRKIEISD